MLIFECIFAILRHPPFLNPNFINESMAKTLTPIGRNVLILMKKLVFLQINQFFNNSDVIEGQPHFWYEFYSHRFTKGLGYFACRTISKWVGVGYAEQLLSNVKQMKDSKRSKLGGASLEKWDILISSAKLNEALKNELIVTTLVTSLLCICKCCIWHLKWVI